MAQILLELYASKTDGQAIESSAERSRIAAEELTREGAPVRLVRTYFLPDDETCFHVYEAPSVDAVRRSRARGLPFDRIGEAVLGPRRQSRTSRRETH
jgi:hypothetical protein